MQGLQAARSWREPARQCGKFMIWMRRNRRSCRSEASATDCARDPVGNSGREGLDSSEPMPVPGAEAAILESLAPIPVAEVEIAGSSRAGAAVGMTLTTNLVVMGIGVFTGVATARILGPVGEGQLAAIQT